MNPKQGSSVNFVTLHSFGEGNYIIWPAGVMHSSMKN